MTIELTPMVRPIKLGSMVPRFELAFRSRVLVDPIIKSVGNIGGTGIRKVLPILGGDFEGPKLRGRILPGGGEWPLIRPDNVGVVDARYTLETDDGVLINIRSTGYRHAPEEVMKQLDAKVDVVDPETYYLRTSTVFEAPLGRYEWLSKYVFVGIGERHPKVLFLDYYRLC